MRKKVAILGSTGSIGTQALSVIEENPDLFEVTLLSAHTQFNLLAEQCRRFKPTAAVLTDDKNFDKFSTLCEGLETATYTHPDVLCKLIEEDQADIVLTAMVGYAGLRPTISAIQSGKDIALANKETLVVAGSLITKLAAEHKVQLLPVDSEHSAIFQCLVGEKEPIEKILLTASGGPFRGRKAADLENVAVADALNHPNWSMGSKITIDSASLMNKGLEVIEAKWLFNLSADQIEVTVHPQSIVHSMVQFVDGSIKAQMGLPDMKLPIVYALAYPNRIETSFPRMDFTKGWTLEFEEPDRETFINLQSAYDALEMGGTAACALNAANEVAVERFMKGEISFLDIGRLNRSIMHGVDLVKEPKYADFVAVHELATKNAQSWTQGTAD